MKPNFFVKAHGLGNEYIVLDSENINFELRVDIVKTLCNVHFGIGADGLLVKVDSEKCDFGLKMYNPDGSLAENCGNGLRVFSKFLYDHGYTQKKNFSIEISGRKVVADIIELKNGKVFLVRIDMGQAEFIADKIPLKYHKQECINEDISIDDQQFNINCVSVGNPHCIVLRENNSLDELLEYGPKIQSQELFPNGVNVQFAKVLSKNKIQAFIYERGAGHTLASGTSSCAIASIAKKRGLTEGEVEIILEGGVLKILIDKDWNIKMTGEAKEVATGYLSDELVNQQ